MRSRKHVTAGNNGLQRGQQRGVLFCNNVKQPCRDIGRRDTVAGDDAANPVKRRSRLWDDNQRATIEQRAVNLAQDHVEPDGG